MNMPLFTADASLYHARAFYAPWWPRDATSDAMQVVPQVQRLIPFYNDPGCLCLGVEDDEIGYSYVAGCVCP